MKLEHISNNFRKFEQNMLKIVILRLLRQLWVVPCAESLNFILSFILKLSSTFNLNGRIQIFGVKHQ